MVLYLNKIAAPVKSPKTVVILRVILLIILREMSNSKVITLLLKGKGIRDKIGNNISMIILHTTTWLQTVDNHIIIMAVSNKEGKAATTAITDSKFKVRTL